MTEPAYYEPLTDPTHLAKLVEEASKTPSGKKILAVCFGIARFLVMKNAAYGDSALNPVRIFSKASSEEQILIRLDDKLSRLSRGSAAGEDVILDLMGYLVLLMVSRDKGVDSDPTLHPDGPLAPSVLQAIRRHILDTGHYHHDVKNGACRTCGWSVDADKSEIPEPR